MVAVAVSAAPEAEPADQLIYAWRVGFKLGGIKPLTAAEELGRLEERNGTVTPKALLMAARPKSAPLHKAFTWADREAAEQYRLLEAGHIIRSLVVVRKGEGGEQSPPVRAYVRLLSSGEDDDTIDPLLMETGHFRHIVRIMRSDDERERLLAQARADLKTWQARYGRLQEFAAVSQVIDGAIGL